MWKISKGRVCLRSRNAHIQCMFTRPACGLGVALVWRSTGCHACPSAGSVMPVVPEVRVGLQLQQGLGMQVHLHCGAGLLSCGMLPALCSGARFCSTPGSQSAGCIAPGCSAPGCMGRLCLAHRLEYKRAGLGRSKVMACQVWLFALFASGAQGALEQGKRPNRPRRGSLWLSG